MSDTIVALATPTGRSGIGVVRLSGGVLNSIERRIIHTTLQQEDDLITESVGDGRDRRLQARLH